MSQKDIEALENVTQVNVFVHFPYVTEYVLLFNNYKKNVTQMNFFVYFPYVTEYVLLFNNYKKCNTDEFFCIFSLCKRICVII